MGWISMEMWCPPGEGRVQLYFQLSLHPPEPVRCLKGMCLRPLDSPSLNMVKRSPSIYHHQDFRFPCIKLEEEAPSLLPYSLLPGVLLWKLETWPRMFKIMQRELGKPHLYFWFDCARDNQMSRFKRCSYFRTKALHAAAFKIQDIPESAFTFKCS